MILAASEVIPTVAATVVGTVLAALVTWASTIVVTELRRRKKGRIDYDHEEAIRRNEDLEVRWAILGKPASEWQPARPGLRQVVIELAADLSEHKRDDALLFENLRISVDRLSDGINSHIEQHS